MDAVWEKESRKDKPIAYIVLDLVEHGELLDLVMEGGPFSEEICRYYLSEILLGLHHAHSKGVTHRDMKSDNILMGKDFQCMIADFGFAAPVIGRDGSGKLKTQLGTREYFAPEVHAGEEYSGQKVDLFATAIILFTMMAGTFPYN